MGIIWAFIVSLHAQLPDEADVHEPDSPASAVPGFLKTESIVEHE
jgi:hypothetical protein